MVVVVDAHPEMDMAAVMAMMAECGKGSLKRM
jgi:hypothetical protein